MYFVQVLYFELSLFIVKEFIGLLTRVRASSFVWLLRPVLSSFDQLPAPCCEWKAKHRQMIEVYRLTKVILVSLLVFILGRQSGLMPAIPLIILVISFPQLPIHHFLSGPELKLDLDKKNQPMQSPKNLFCVNKVSRILKFENTDTRLLYIFAFISTC